MTRPVELSAAEARRLGLIPADAKVGPRARPRTTRRVVPARSYTWACGLCPETFSSWASVERHGDATGHLTVRCLDASFAPPATT